MQVHTCKRVIQRGEPKNDKHTHILEPNFLEHPVEATHLSKRPIFSVFSLHRVKKVSSLACLVRLVSTRCSACQASGVENSKGKIEHSDGAWDTQGFSPFAGLQTHSFGQCWACVFWWGGFHGKSIFCGLRGCCSGL